QHLFSLVPPAPDLETPPRRGQPPPVAVPRSKRLPKPGSDLFVCPPRKHQDHDSDEEEEDKENWLPPPPRQGLPPRLQEKLEKLFQQFRDDLETDLGAFYSTLVIPQSLF
ncbi:E4 protein, partial [Panthera leo persica papillomavirus 1]